MKISPCRAVVLAGAIWAGSGGLGGSMADGQGLLDRFRPVSRVTAQPDESYELTDRHGPWLIMAATFNGEGAEQQAQELALELRQRFNLPAYQHDMAFDYSGDVGGRGIDEYGAPIRRRLQRGEKVHEWAVLVGDFESIDDPRGQQILDRIKTLQPDALTARSGERSAQSLSEVRRFHAAVMARMGKNDNRGPMSKAFFAPNPLLPKEYFVPKGVDRFVAEMNDGVKHSLLDAPRKYTVQVATFRGSSVLQTSHTADDEGMFGKRRRDPGKALIEAAESAHLLVDQLREHGIEAYEFHNRTESIVTIGSFDQAARRLPDGRVVPSADAQRIIEVFGAAYDTPADPLNGDDFLNRSRREQEALQLASGFNGQQGQIAMGLNPKHVKILRGKKLVRTIPMDIHPQVIEAPRRSISAAFMR